MTSLLQRIAIVGAGTYGTTLATALQDQGIGSAITLYPTDHIAPSWTRPIRVAYQGAEATVSLARTVWPTNAQHVSRFCTEKGMSLTTIPYGVSAALEDNALEWSTQSFQALLQPCFFAKTSYYRGLLDAWDFINDAFYIARDNPRMTLGACAHYMRIHPTTLRSCLLPLLNAHGTYHAQRIHDYPASFIVDALRRYGWHHQQATTVLGGDAAYCAQLLSLLGEGVTLASGEIQQVISHDTGITVQTRDARTEYDALLWACPAFHIRLLLKNPNPTLKEAVAALPTRQQNVYLHKDPSHLPKKRLHWTTRHYQTSLHPAHTQHTSFTYWLNPRESLNIPYPLFLTYHPLTPIAEGHLFATSTYDTPLLSPETLHHHAQLERLQGEAHMWFCGTHPKTLVDDMEEVLHETRKVAQRVLRD